VEADFQRYYGLDVLDLYRGRLSPHKAARLFGQLPPDGAVGRANAGEGYTITDHLILEVIDLLVGANWQRANQGRKKSDQTPPPKPARRPGITEPSKRTITAADLAAWRRRHQHRLQDRGG
jgi:hypothetical protein